MNELDVLFESIDELNPIDAISADGSSFTATESFNI